MDGEGCGYEIGGDEGDGGNERCEEMRWVVMRVMPSQAHKLPPPHYLCPLSIILPLRCYLSVLKPAEHVLDPFGGVSQHRLQGDARSKFAVLRECLEAVCYHGRDDGVIVRVLTTMNRRNQVL